ncbi:MAG: hypothetical protein COX80_04585 [Candidatus Magasanikbacteria bacterium CG_4_10_14_0_2_um_filter_33_14]|uniref:Squalene cyclase C-terminal domain-containing protein n=1 Tax=Candidatus Magasanikbacteria bacterium CG_4_10_14_0_2_um_filter_33_14 TaxID=1974636 RepID=A0A2M7V986_9BACT|nr:MAG: hypothetical protein COX80_04585 [Candidatus Magasanikbacteria bacterium CG_4_10_14_0_2_um_filter_33_14]
MKKVLSKFLFVTAVTIVSLSAFNFVHAETTSTDSNVTTSSTTDIVIVSSTDSGLENTTTNNSNITLPSVNLTVRYNDEIVYSGSIELTTTTYHDEINNLDYPLITSTVFSALVRADAFSTNFSITDDQFNSYYNSFYLRCITLQFSTTTEACDNWQYTINGQYPYNSMDTYELTGDENIYIYFGDRYKLNTEKNEYTTDETVTSTLQEYDFTNNTWQNKIAQEILMTEPIASDYSNWPPQIFSSSTTNDLGEVYFNNTTTGTYYLTLPDDYWPGVTISITSTISTSTENNIIENPSSGGGSSSNTVVDHSPTPTQISEAVNKILNYFKTQQNENGSILDGGTSDWIAMSFGANNQYAQDIKNANSNTSLYDYIYNYNFTDPSDLNLCAAYPRHILALLASGVAKTDSKIIDLENEIISIGCYQNNLYGQNGINDDIFALLSLSALDYNDTSQIVNDIKNTILADQTNEGAFTWTGYPGADVTGAVINALDYAQTKGLSVDPNVITNAKNYLKNNQLSDGGWGYSTSDILTTSWAMLGVNAENDNMSDWKNNEGYNPKNVLVDNLQADGTYDTSWDPGTVDWFGLKHAVPSLLGKSWPIILDPIIQTNNITSGSSIDMETTTSIPTSTEEIVTSTPEIIEDITTSTPEIEIVPINFELPVANTTTTFVETKKIEPKLIKQTFVAKNNVKEVQGEKITGKNTSKLDIEKEIIPQPTENLSPTNEKKETPLPTNKKVALGLGAGTLLYGLFLLFKLFV